MSLNTSLPAFLDPLLKDNQPEEDFEEEQTPTSKKKKNAEPKITRQRNYSNTEDIQLCELWLDYMIAIPDPLQTPVGLKSRWCTLQGAINKFSACVKQIEHRNQSGATNKDKLTYALRLYSQTHRKAFAHIACYKILVNTPKWNEYITNLQNKSASQKRKRQDTTTTIADLGSPGVLATNNSLSNLSRQSHAPPSENDRELLTSDSNANNEETTDSKQAIVLYHAGPTLAPRCKVPLAEIIGTPLEALPLLSSL
ncbi:hypothetical protein PCANC_09318 [Puccinia coronata f. sp. avenae]|uniref:No apical meristem-associated C-terminal domain-containing protein n=1 Tax=Puccinia coronata f. sp. avenae TaxID=200324 RepID=A0A2N5T5I9_9BASI|nr:hypothetical protein PCANC_09318 [Puccinia coronata f. sp. avenae]